MIGAIPLVDMYAFLKAYKKGSKVSPRDEIVAIVSPVLKQM